MSLEALGSLVEPFWFMGLALTYLPGTILVCLRAGDLGTLLSPGRLRELWFARFWASVGPGLRDMGSKNVVPLVQGRVTHGVVPPAALAGDDQRGQPHPHPAVSGTVLEVGPGSGLWVSLFSPSSLPGVSKVYGVEPNPSLHPALRQRISEAGLDESGTYEIVPVGIEDLESSGRVAAESVDCIITLKCLCSIPSPEHNIRQLYRYLKPGGRWYVYEHVRCFPEQGIAMRVYQYLLGFVWPRIIGGCQITRDTGRYLREAGPWSHVDLHPLAGEQWFFTLPSIIGVLTK
ncbi:hypothetical protein VTJ83DRAFT_4029 [Remersonia thermophila]|uniref:Methyltransferase type 11 domain-containing protein n=1 Tax=Remersonia thermophila TaxID=72144 RepID=A0ABR4DFP4_9PEZI